MKFLKFSSSLLCCLLLISCAAADKRLYGAPSLSTAVYVNQALYAKKLCTEENKLVSEPGAEKFVDYVKRSIGPDYYVEHYDEYATANNYIRKKFESQSSFLSEENKKQYCDQFAQDIAAMQKIGTLRTIQRHIDFRHHFSPPEQASENQQMFAAAVLLLAQAIPTAQGISKTSSGNYSGASQSFNTSKTIGVATGSLTNNVGAPNYCGSFENFAGITTEEIRFDWNSYSSIMNCN